MHLCCSDTILHLQYECTHRDYTQWSYINEIFPETSSYRPNNNKKQTKGMDMVKILEGSENLKKQNKAGSRRHLHCWLPSMGLWSK